MAGAVRNIDVSDYVASKDQVIGFADFRSRASLLVAILSALLAAMYFDNLQLSLEDTNSIDSDQVELGLLIAAVRGLAMVPFAWLLLLWGESYKSLARAAPPVRLRLSNYLPMPALLTGYALGLALGEILIFGFGIFIPPLSKVLVELGLKDEPTILNLEQHSEFAAIVVVALSLLLTLAMILFITVRTIQSNRLNLRVENWLRGPLKNAKSHHVADLRYRLFSSPFLFRLTFIISCLTAGSFLLMRIVEPAVIDFFYELSEKQNAQRFLFSFRSGENASWPEVVRAMYWISFDVAPGVVFVLVSFLLVPILYRLWSAGSLWARRGALRTVEDLIEVDGRAPTLYLRSFEAEDTSLDVRQAGQQRNRLFDLLVRSNAVRLEEEIATAANLFGPMIALDNPRAKQLKLGAARRRVDDDEWQAEILSFMDQSGFIVLVFNDTSGIRWELEQIKAQGHTHKTVVMFPPNTRYDLYESNNLAAVRDLFDVGETDFVFSERLVALVKDGADTVKIEADSASLTAFRAAVMLSREFMTRGFQQNRLPLKVKPKRHFVRPFWRKAGLAVLLGVVLIAGALFWPRENVGSLQETKQHKSSTSLGISSSAQLTAGLRFKECPACPTMVVVPAGSFTMGDVSGVSFANERPAHGVHIEYIFAVGIHEVSWAEYGECLVAGYCKVQGIEKAGGGEGWGLSTRPVINVSWDDAQDYVTWLSAKTGETYRLLTEAEWEYVASTSTRSLFHFGNETAKLCKYANGADQSTDYKWRNKECSDGYGKETAPVGSFAPNDFGLYDVHGNVWEWVQDCYNETYDGAPQDGRAWMTGNCDRRVIRGGAWMMEPLLLRSAARANSKTTFRNPMIGFRVARDFH